MVHIALAATHVAGRHKPDTQRPWQQSFVSLHAPPLVRQLAERHTPPEHVSPVQQSLESVQPPPAAEQPERSWHMPPTQLPEQHTPDVTHDSPPIAQTQAPSRHNPLQHSFDDEQPSTSGRHTTWQMPARHSPLQQSANDEHVWPTGLHIGSVGFVMPHERANTELTRTKARMSGRTVACMVAGAPRDGLWHRGGT